MQDDSFQDNIVYKSKSYKWNAKYEKITNLKELLRPHQLLQGAPVKSIKSGIEIGKTCLSPIGLPCLSKFLKEGQPPQRHHLPTIGKEISP